jgi:hypothetical protein
MPRPPATEAAHRWGHRSGGAPFTVIADDLAEALAFAGLSRYAGFVVRQVIRQSWEPARRQRAGQPLPDPIPVRLKPRDLARRSGLDAGNICRAVNRLVEQRILIRTDDGLLFNKRADEWEDAPGEPLLTPEMVRFCEHAGRPRRVVSRDNTPLSPQTTPVVSADNTPLSPETTANAHPPDPLNKTARASADLIQTLRGEENKFPPSAPPKKGGGTATDGLAAPRPGPDGPGRGRRGEPRESKEAARQRRHREIVAGLANIELPECIARTLRDRERKEASCRPTSGFSNGPTAT